VGIKASAYDLDHLVSSIRDYSVVKAIDLLSFIVEDIKKVHLYEYFPRTWYTPARLLVTSVQIALTLLNLLK